MTLAADWGVAGLVPISVFTAGAVVDVGSAEFGTRSESNAPVSAALTSVALLFSFAFLIFAASIDPPLNLWLAAGMGDFTYGFLSYALSGQFRWDGLIRFILATILGAIIFTAFMILVQSMAFWMGRVSNFSSFIFNAIITFGIYPITLFDNYAKLILFTVIPAAFIGAIPAAFARLQHKWRRRRLRSSRSIEEVRSPP